MSDRAVKLNRKLVGNRVDPSPESGSGGQDNEIGSEYRARVGALLTTALLLRDDVSNVGAPITGVPAGLRAEADHPVDDLVLRFDDQTTACIQVKVRVGLTTDVNKPLGKAMRQFVEAFRASDRYGNGPLILAYAVGTRPLADLGRWCEKLRFAEEGVPSAKELAAAESLRMLLSHFGVTSASEVRELARRVHLWETDPREGDVKSVAIQRLRSAGVPSALLVDAYDYLATRIRLLAQHRAGDNAQGLTASLRQKGYLQLRISDQPPNIRAALLLDDFRERTVRQGRTLSAFGVPAVVANVPLSEGDASVQVELPLRADENVASQRSLSLALRRRGRVLVVGEGGSGKSTALRVLASELARDPGSSPLPLSAHFQEVLDHGNDPLRAAIANATSHLPFDDASLLESTIRCTFAAGKTAFLLDGFDEIVGGERLASAVQTWLDRAPSSTEVVVATRPSALGAAAAYDWPRLRLAEPQNPFATAHAIVTAVATDARHDEAWIRERELWIADHLDRDEGLNNTPLMVVLLATLAATAESHEELPTSRTTVLWQVLQEVMTKWEVGTRRNGVVEVGDLGRTAALEALQRALIVLSRIAVLAKQIDLRRALAEDLVDQLGPMPPAHLRACVEDAAQFWLSTGMFSESGSHIRARPRSLAEAALAREAISTDAPIKVALEYRNDRVGWPVLAMVAESRAEVRRAWAELIAKNGDPDELIAIVDAHLGGATLDENEVNRLCRSQAIIEAASDLRDSARIIEALLALRPAPNVVASLRARIAAVLPLHDHVAIQAAMLLRLETLTESDEGELRAFLEAPRPRSGRGDDGIHRVESLDDFTLRTLQSTAIWSVGHSRAGAELATESLDGLKTPRFIENFAQVLVDSGHFDLAERIGELPLDYRFELGDHGDFAAATRRALVIATRSGSPRPLAWRECRRLDELADLWATMTSKWWHARWVETRPDVLERFQRIVVQLGGFDVGAIAGQANQVLDELERDPDTDDALRDQPAERPLTRWDLVEDAAGTVDEIVSIFGSIPYQCLHPLSRGLACAPCRQHAFEAVVGVQPTLRGPWKLEASRLAFALAADHAGLGAQWSTSDDVYKRKAVAYGAGLFLEANTGSATHLVSALLNDRDRGVQAIAISSLAKAHERGTPIGGAIRDELEQVRAASPKGFECLWCGASAAASQTSCASCDTSGPDTRNALNRLLGRPETGASREDVLASLMEWAPRSRIHQRSVLE